MQLINRYREDVETTLKEVRFLEELADKLAMQLAERLHDEQLITFILDRGTSQDDAYTALGCKTISSALNVILDHGETKEEISY